MIEPFCVTTPAALKNEVVKSDSKIIISLVQSNSVTHFVDAAEGVLE